jgi:hypothetical protein
MFVVGIASSSILISNRKSFSSNFSSPVRTSSPATSPPPNPAYALLQQEFANSVYPHQFPPESPAMR